MTRRIRLMGLVIGVTSIVLACRPAAAGTCETAKLTSDDAAPLREFGDVVGLEDDVLIVSNICITPDGVEAVYVFRRTGEHWSQVQMIE